MSKKVLIISHTVFSPSDNMGKTLSAYFSEFEPDSLAQFYIHSQVPTSDVCHSYFRITDKEAICSVLFIPCGKSYTGSDIEKKRVNSRTDTGISAVMYQKARKRTPLVYIARNLWWKLSHWNNKRFNNWIDAFKPDCVFFAAGDYAFMYDIAYKIARKRNIPIYICCMDDYFFYNKNEDSLAGRLQHKIFMKSVNKCVSYSKKIFCICEKMSLDYSKLFSKECITIHTPSSIKQSVVTNKNNNIVYLGNLGHQRHKQLIDIGKTIKALGIGPGRIDVYSSESRKEILDEMNEGNGIVFHGSVSADKVEKIMRESLAVIHTESFDKTTRKTVRYSVSTKIADSLACGTCIFAYGPEEIASIEYLKNNDAAICCTNKENLGDSIKRLINDEKRRQQIIENALVIAKRNHSIEVTPKIIKNELI